MADFDIEGTVDARGGHHVSDSFAKAAASAPDHASKPKSKQWKQLRLATHVAFVFHHPRSYKKEGDPQMETPPMLQARRQLKQSDNLRALVQRFWSIIDMLKEPDGTLARNSYILLNKKLQKAMVADYNEHEAQHDAEVDWRRDIVAVRDRRIARGEASNTAARGMEFEDFFESMFELADMWTDTVQDGHYCFFFEQVLKAVVKNINANELEFKPTEDIQICESFAPQSQMRSSLSHRTSQLPPSRRSSRLSSSHRNSFRQDGRSSTNPSAVQSNSGSGTLPKPSRSRKPSHLGGRAHDTLNRLRSHTGNESHKVRNDSTNQRRESQCLKRLMSVGGRSPSAITPTNESENDSKCRHNRRRSSTIHGNLRFLESVDEAEALAQLSPRTFAGALAKLPPQARVEALAHMSPRARVAAINQLSPRARAEALAQLSPRALAETLALLSPRAQADTLAQLSPRSRAEALAQLSPRARAKVKAQAQLSLHARAEALAQLSPQVRTEALAQLSSRARTEALAQLSPRARTEALSQLSPRARAEALSQLSPRARAETLSQLSPRVRAAALANLSPRMQAGVMRLMTQLSLRRGAFNRPHDVPARQTMPTPSHTRGVSNDMDADPLRLTRFVFPPVSAPRAGTDTVRDWHPHVRKNLLRNAHRTAGKHLCAMKTSPSIRSSTSSRRLRKPRTGVNSTLTMPKLMLRPPPL